MCKTIKQKVKFKAPPAAIYRLLTDAKQRSTLTGKGAKIDNQVGGRFSVDAGYATGINVDLSPAKRVVQAWRCKGFPEGIYSMAAFVLSPTKDGGTELVLTHRGVPKEMIPRIEREWREHYWKRMKEFLE